MDQREEELRLKFEEFTPGEIVKIMFRGKEECYRVTTFILSVLQEKEMEAQFATNGQ